MLPDTSQYTIPDLELLERLDSSSSGLSSEQATRSLDEAGPNTVASGGRVSVVRDLLERCRNPLVIQLLIIAVVCYLTGDLRSTVVVGSMVFLSVFLSYIQETRSSRAVEKLQKLVPQDVHTGRSVRAFLRFLRRHFSNALGTSEDRMGRLALL